MSSPDQQTEGTQEFKGKCDYIVCPKDSKDEVPKSRMQELKKTNYIFHDDCMNKWIAENRAQGIMRMQIRIKKLDEMKKVTLLPAS